MLLSCRESLQLGERGLLTQETQLSFNGNKVVELWQSRQHVTDCPKSAEADAVFDAHFGNTVTRWYRNHSYPSMAMQLWNHGGARSMQQIAPSVQRLWLYLTPILVRGTVAMLGV